MEYDLIIIGGGSAGVGSALAASDYDKDKKILLIEKGPVFGGTSTLCGVCNWEPGIPSALGYHKVIAERLMENGSGFVAKTTKFYTNDYPFGLSEPCDDNYTTTYKRAGVSPYDQRRFMFYPQAMHLIMKELLIGKGVHYRLNCEFIDVLYEDKYINKIIVKSNDIKETFVGKMYIDASSNLLLCRKANCSVKIGAESKNVYNEPGAPLEYKKDLNGVTLCFEIVPKDKRSVDEIPLEYNEDVSHWKNFDNGERVPSCIYKFPNGTINVNMLPTMDGSESFDVKDEDLYNICKSRVYKYFEWLQKTGILDGYKISYIYPFVGRREFYRLEGVRVLNENHIREGIKYPNTYIAYGDHPLDTHGGSSALTQIKEKYGIFYECLLPKEYNNLFVAGKGASFSHIAASSCRLSRTMMALGEAAGVASIMALHDNCSNRNVDITKLQQYLKIN